MSSYSNWIVWSAHLIKLNFKENNCLYEGKNAIFCPKHFWKDCILQNPHSVCMSRSLWIYIHTNVCMHLFPHFTAEDVELLQVHYILSHIHPACMWKSSNLIGRVTWYLLFDRLTVAGHGFLRWILCIFKETHWFTSKTSFSFCWEMHTNSQPDL